MSARRLAALAPALAIAAAACGTALPSASPPNGTGLPATALPSATTGRTLSPGLVPPPASFDPRAIEAFSYGAEGGLAGVWAGPIGRPDLSVALIPPVPEAEASFGEAVRFPDGSVTYHAATDEVRRLMLLTPGGAAQTLLDGAAPNGSPARSLGTLATARLGELDDEGIWQVWLDGRQPVQVLPPILRPELAMRDSVALSPDGRAVAAAACDGWLQVRFPGQEPERLPFGAPIGFAPNGDLLAYRDCGNAEPMRIPAAGGQAVTLGQPESGYQAALTPDGSRLVVVHPTALAETVLVVDLGSGALTTFAIDARGWDVAPETTDRYVVLSRSEGFPGTFLITYAIHDLVEGWTGYVQVDSLPPAPSG